MKTGRDLYLESLKEKPNYHTGEPRKSWEELPTYVRHNWNKGARHEHGTL